MLNNNLEINGLISNFDEDVKRIPYSYQTKKILVKFAGTNQIK